MNESQEIKPQNTSNESKIELSEINITGNSDENIASSNEPNNNIPNLQILQHAQISVVDLPTSKCSLLFDYLQNNYTFVFLYFFFITAVIFLLQSIDFINSKNFNLCQWPLKSKKQFYRLLTHHFIHSNVVEFIVNMVLFHYFIDYLERKIGSLFLMVYISNSIFLTSCVFYY